MTSIGKETEAVNAYLIKTVREKERGEKTKKKNRGGGGRGSTLTSSRKDWAELYGCIK